MDRLQNTRTDIVSNNILDIFCTRFIIIDKGLYPTKLWTDYQTHEQTDTTIYWTSANLDSSLMTDICFKQSYGQTTKHRNGHCIQQYTGHQLI